MDAQQFKEFMAVFQTQQNQLMQALLSTNSQASPEKLEHSKRSENSFFIQPFEIFDAKNESFKLYKQRFENFLEIKNILNNKELCAKVLLNSIGAYYYNLLADLISPKLPTELSYDEIIIKFENHLCPKPNVLVVQHKFLSTYQTETQSIADYITALRKNIIDCEFTCECKSSIADVFLRAQFVRGIRDNDIRQQILQSEVTSFNDITQRAISLEATKIDCQELSMKSPVTKSDNINKVSRHRSPSFRSKTPVQPKSFNKSRFSRSNSMSRINYEKLGINNMCLRCGRNNHLANDCRCDKNALYCKSCKRTGHVQRVCIKTLMEEHRSKRNFSKDTNLINDDDEALQRYGVNKIIDVFQNRLPDTEKYFVTLKIEGKQVRFEVDSGSGYSFMPRDEFNRLNISTNLQSSDVTFRSYTGNIFKPDGKIRVNVTYNGKTSREELYIVSEEYKALLGCTWIRHLRINLQEIDSRKEQFTREFRDQEIRKHLKNDEYQYKSRQLSVGDRVQARCFINNKYTWKLGKIIKKFGKLHYQVELDNCYVFKRHINQLRKTEIPKKSVRFAPDTKLDEDPTPETPRFSTPPKLTTLPVPQLTTPPVPQLRPSPVSRPKTPSVPQLRRSSRERKKPTHLQDYYLY